MLNLLISSLILVNCFNNALCARSCVFVILLNRSSSFEYLSSILLFISS